MIDQPNHFWNAIVTGHPLTQDVFDRMQQKIQLHLKTHRQGRMLYWIDGKFWIRCYMHRRLEPATWLV